MIDIDRLILFISTCYILPIYNYIFINLYISWICMELLLILHTVNLSKNDLSHSISFEQNVFTILKGSNILKGYLDIIKNSNEN